MLSTFALIASFVLVLANAFFVASEFALVKMRTSRLEQLAGLGHRRAKAALHVSQHLDAYLSANQLGITLASLALGWLGEPAFAALIAGPLARIGILSPAAIHSVALTASFIIITFLHVVVGELAPKSLAIQRTEPVALWTAQPLHAFYLVAFPLIWTLNKSAQLVLRVIGLRAATEMEMAHSPEEMRLLLRRIAIDPEARRLIDRVFDYTHRIARHVMTFREDVVALPANMQFAEALRAAMANQYTRYPIIEPESDSPVGYVHIKDLMLAQSQGRAPEIRQLAREPVFVTEEMPVERIRQALQRRRVHLAVVRNSAGAFTGIVTLEDLLEEFVGEIQDEQDVGEVPPILRLGGAMFDIDGRVTLDVVRRELGLPLADAPEGVETIGGYVASAAGVVPQRGERVEAGGVKWSVLAVRGQRVLRVRARAQQEAIEAAESAQPSDGDAA